MRITTGICGLLAAAMLSGGAALAQTEDAEAAASDMPEAESVTTDSDGAAGQDATGSMSGTDTDADPGTMSGSDTGADSGAMSGSDTAETEPGGAAAGMGTDAAPAHSATISDAEGAQIGAVELSFSASGLAVVDISFTGVPAGEHAVHFHQTGMCEAPFDSAGDHLAGDMDHGVMAQNGPHPGDMPNITVPDSGEISLTYFVPGLTEDLVADDDGTAFVIHEASDDYRSQPSGDAGGRLGCAVVTEAAG
ncbi:Cu/Zn superoxide dismutase [Paracoccus isoporae]|uniref:Superoxide dismutase [Cu-Zn] n=1 Tax=Paracoccus isoporae TaxID=591205 RepID=A0A1G6WAP8_9RHOB|nr:superoxide dismutase family protein [Paracoccus isoporae]SDD62888.1 Cu/Zn superoxide dismutase [Paracoccus isoporae]